MIPKPRIPGGDLLFGAAAISNFMLGSKTEGSRKRILRAGPEAAYSDILHGRDRVRPEIIPG